MKLTRLLIGEYHHKKYFPKDTIVLTGETGAEIYCSNFHMENGKIPVFIYIPESGKLYKTKMRNEYTREMYNYAQKFKDTSKPLNYRQMMAHDRKKKGGGSGKRLTPFCDQVTDYECRKEPLHDFRRVYC